MVSGLAFGVDAAAHRGALDAHGPTIAVVGSGIDDEAIYPRANFPLAKEILANGGLFVSENPAGTKPQTWDFPKRNRVIAALARATVVVEAPEKSGALITAKYALELGRDVYAVPADALKASARGSNRLIAAGAVPLLDPQELIETVFPRQKTAGKVDRVEFKPHNQEEAAIVKTLASGAKHLDEIVAGSGLPAPTVQATLANLELCGAVHSLPGMRFALI